MLTPFIKIVLWYQQMTVMRKEKPQFSWWLGSPSSCSCGLDSQNSNDRGAYAIKNIIFVESLFIYGRVSHTSFSFLVLIKHKRSTWPSPFVYTTRLMKSELKKIIIKMWNVTRDKGTHGEGWTFSQNFSSPALMGLLKIVWKNYLMWSQCRL